MSSPQAPGNALSTDPIVSHEAHRSIRLGMMRLSDIADGLLSPRLDVSPFRRILTVWSISGVQGLGIQRILYTRKCSVSRDWLPNTSI